MSLAEYSLLDRLQRRARLLQDIRYFFEAQGVMEVEVPILGVTAVTDPHLDSFSFLHRSQTFFLQTSPEFFMKRLLAQGSGAIYSLAKVFREDESGYRHNPEFTMLEWYRPNFSDEALMDDVVNLIRSLAPSVVIRRLSYAQVFQDFVGVDPHLASTDELQIVAQQRIGVTWENEPKSTWLDLLFSHCVEPKLQAEFTFIYDYPECQAALARKGVDAQGRCVAKRFEIFWQGVELGNGYWELTDAQEQRQRFIDDNHTRRGLGKPQIAIDEKFMQALEAGLPDCAGIAIGVDRLLMCLLGKQHINDVLAFPFSAL